MLAITVVLVLVRPATAQTWERDLDLMRQLSGAYRPLQNVYWVSLPIDPSLPDAADTGTSLSNKCVGDPDGPSTGDGLFNADDLICHWWTARSDRPTAGTFTLSHPRTDRCVMDFRTATVALGEIRFARTPFDIVPGEGLQVRITVLPGSPASPRNRALFTGDHDPASPGRTIAATPTCAPGQTVDCCDFDAMRFDLVAVPYNALFLTSYELLCGLEGVDWRDDDGDGRPDACWEDVNANRRYDLGEPTTGLFDGRST